MKYGVLVERVNQILISYTMPLTLRQVYYRLVAAGLIPNTRSSYNQLQVVNYWYIEHLCGGHS